jgi:hypothetical protein
MEACKPVATEGLRLALTPTINQMRYVLAIQYSNVSSTDFSKSVIGIIAIPGMMTGAILGGSSVEQASKLQMVIMFMISASTALSAIFTTVFALGMVVDSEHRVRSDRIDERPHAVWRGRDWLIRRIIEGFWTLLGNIGSKVGMKRRNDDDDRDETERLLG